MHRLRRESHIFSKGPLFKRTHPEKKKIIYVDVTLSLFKPSYAITN